ncbi:hypothetical protein OEA41_007438 [Lepraria neglecta]|uniref:Uncharacterized protein n=1 Tax=Lepraria neglecta TaxID=209136 RepID=A0AAD9ZCQ1_9LECA|nr:hypothetical protein OEA41_007438 [Lepraria neglecta]
MANIQRFLVPVCFILGLIWNLWFFGKDHFQLALPHTSLRAPSKDTNPIHNRTLGESEANAGKSIARNNITSALIRESDNDWDPRIKSQLTNFSEAAVPMTNFVDISGDLRASSIDKNINASPYGNDWDMLWLGTCGAQGDIFYAYNDTTATPYHK